MRATLEDTRGFLGFRVAQNDTLELLIVIRSDCVEMIFLKICPGGESLAIYLAELGLFLSLVVLFGGIARQVIQLFACFGQVIDELIIALPHSLQ